MERIFHTLHYGSIHAFPASFVWKLWNEKDVLEIDEFCDPIISYTCFLGSQ